MSGWTIITVRGKKATDYDYTRENNHDRFDATSDIVATMDQDDRVRKWTNWSSHVYAYLNCSRYDFDFAESLFEDYGEMIEDAVVLGANDTTDTGVARYYDRPDLGQYIHEYEESQSEDGCYVGEIALQVVGGRHSIVARDPFHNQCGRNDGWYNDSGQVRDVE